MSLPSAKRKVMGRIDVAHDHHQQQYSSPGPSSSSNPARASAGSQTSTPIRRLGNHASGTPGSSGRAKVDLAALEGASATRDSSYESTPPLLRRAATSLGTTSSNHSASPSPFLRKSVASPALATTAAPAPVTPFLAGTAPSGLGGRRSPEARQSPFERGETPANVTIRSGSIRRVRDHGLDSSGSPSFVFPTSATMSNLASVASKSVSGSSPRAVASPPVNGRTSPVRTHMRSKTSYHIPTAASLNATPTSARVNVGGKGFGVVGSPFTSLGSHAAVATLPTTASSGSPSPSSSATGKTASSGSYFPQTNDRGRSQWETPDREQSHTLPLRASAGLEEATESTVAASRRSSASTSLSSSSLSAQAPPSFQNPQQQTPATSRQGSSRPTLSTLAERRSHPSSRDSALSPRTPVTGSSYSARPRLGTSTPSAQSLQSAISTDGEAGTHSTPLSGQYPSSLSAPSSGLLSPKYEQSAFVSSSNALTLEYAQLRVERKFADLEITNKSLLAINAGLEVAKHRQGRELRDLKRRLREGRGLSSGAAMGALTPGALGRYTDEDEEDDDYFGEEPEEAQEDPELEAAHVRCRDLIESMLSTAREAILSRYVAEEKKSKVLTAGEVQDRDAGVNVSEVDPGTSADNRLLAGQRDREVEGDGSVSWTADSSLASSMSELTTTSPSTAPVPVPAPVETSEVAADLQIVQEVSYTGSEADNLIEQKVSREMEVEYEHPPPFETAGGEEETSQDTAQDTSSTSLDDSMVSSVSTSSVDDDEDDDDEEEEDEGEPDDQNTLRDTVMTPASLSLWSNNGAADVSID